VEKPTLIAINLGFTTIVLRHLFVQIEADAELLHAFRF